MAAEPAVRAPLAGELDAALEAVADFVDLKVPFLAGTRARAPSPRRAGTALVRRDTVRVAGPACFTTSAGCRSNPIWESAGRSVGGEADTARLHPRHTERCLAHVAGLAAEAHLASMHHERLDGSGYHREMSAVGLPLAARVLAAADCWVAMTSERPYRAALAPHDATAALRQEAALGRLDPQVVDAILAVSGQHQRPRGGTWPAGLSDREVDVLRLAMRGLTNPDIAARLSISPKTVGNHLQHVYAKLGVGTRAAATFTAMRLGLAADDYG
jgi:DNA-binding CsgD family transcriptional regulator